MKHPFSRFQDSPLVRKAYSAADNDRHSVRGLGFLTEYAENLSEGQICAWLIGDRIDRTLPFGAISSAYNVETAVLCHEIRQLETVDAQDLTPYASFSPKAKEIVLATLMLALDSFVLKSNAPLFAKRGCIETAEAVAAAMMPMGSVRMRAAFEELLRLAKATAPLPPRQDGSSQFGLHAVH